ncbi:hypothetical protein TTY48_33030 [Tsukamurella sp. TY48]|nr:hypothetical protein TTY48_33030 [Tsukamurella sp. TY48]
MEFAEGLGYALSGAAWARPPARAPAGSTGRELKPSIEGTRATNVGCDPAAAPRRRFSPMRVSLYCSGVIDGSSRPPRRTQEQRREATRTALLDATIESLAEVGYTGMTTRAVAARAGVTHGAQQHHYGTKLALADAALKRFAESLATDGPAARQAKTLDEDPARSEWERCGELLDAIWALYSQPIIGTIAEMLALSRTDADIRERMAENSTVAHLITRTTGAMALPVLGRIEGFGEWILTAVTAMRGLQMLEPLRLDGDAALTWTSMRRDLIAALRVRADEAGVTV